MLPQNLLSRSKTPGLIRQHVTPTWVIPLLLLACMAVALQRLILSAEVY